jgi:peptidoglycan/xylan/chitin deacetylase (PgdA/CDA1 family)
MGLGVIFHHFVGMGHPHIQGALTADEFDQLLTSVGVHKFLDPHSWAAARLSGKLRDDQHCLTFDDALQSQIDIALPVLESHRLKGFFFVYSSVLEGHMELFEIYRYFKNQFYDSIDSFYVDFYAELARQFGGVEFDGQLASEEARGYLHQYSFYTDADRRFRYLRDRLLSGEQYDAIMRRLMDIRQTSPTLIADNIWIGISGLQRIQAGGHLIGLHSHTHPTNMVTMPRDQQELEYTRNMECLTKALGYRPDTMAHASGSYNEDTLEILRALDIKLGFRSDDGVGGGTMLELPRLDYKLFVERRFTQRVLNATHGHR